MRKSIKFTFYWLNKRLTMADNTFTPEDLNEIAKTAGVLSDADLLDFCTGSGIAENFCSNNADISLRLDNSEFEVKTGKSSFDATSAELLRTMSSREQIELARTLGDEGFLQAVAESAKLKSLVKSDQFLSRRLTRLETSKSTSKSTTVSPKLTGNFREDSIILSALPERQLTKLAEKNPYIEDVIESNTFREVLAGTSAAHNYAAPLSLSARRTTSPVRRTTSPVRAISPAKTSPRKPYTNRDMASQRLSQERARTAETRKKFASQRLSQERARTAETSPFSTQRALSKERTRGISPERKSKKSEEEIAIVACAWKLPADETGTKGSKKTSLSLDRDGVVQTSWRDRTAR
jgi:hypothetical protein